MLTSTRVWGIVEAEAEVDGGSTRSRWHRGQTDGDSKLHVTTATQSRCWIESTITPVSCWIDAIGCLVHRLKQTDPVPLVRRAIHVGFTASGSLPFPLRAGHLPRTLNPFTQPLSTTTAFSPTAANHGELGSFKVAQIWKDDR